MGNIFKSVRYKCVVTADLLGAGVSSVLAHAVVVGEAQAGLHPQLPLAQSATRGGSAGAVRL